MLVPHTIEVDEDFIVKFYQYGAGDTGEYKLVFTVSFLQQSLQSAANVNTKLDHLHPTSPFTQQASVEKNPNLGGHIL